MKLNLLRRLLLAGLIVVLGGAIPAVVSAAERGERRPDSRGGGLTENEYWNLVESSRQLLTHLKGASPDEIKGGLETLTRQWQAFSTVTLPDGDTVQIDNSYLLSALTAPEPKLDQIESVFINLESAHKSYPSDVFTTADLESLTAILARPEFRGLNQPTNPLNDWLHNLWMRLLKSFTDLLARIFGSRRISLPSTYWSPLGILSAVLLALILFLAARSIYADVISGAKPIEDGSDPDKALTSDSALEMARALSRNADYRSAVRYLYLSCLLLLDERGLLRYDRSKTNREVLRSVSDTPELAQPLRDVVEVFDRVWYGYHSLDEDSFSHYSQRVEELREKQK